MDEPPSPEMKDTKGIGKRAPTNMHDSIESVRQNFELKLNSLKEDFTRNLNDLTKRGPGADSAASETTKGFESAGPQLSPRRSYNAHVDDILNQVNQRSAENLKGAA